MDPNHDLGFVGDAPPVWVPNGTQVAYNECGVWVVANADGTGEAQPIGGAPSTTGGPPPLHRTWGGSGLSSQWDLAQIGQVDHLTHHLHGPAPPLVDLVEMRGVGTNRWRW
jgi:hypothetical protein